LTYCHLVANLGCISLGRACRRTHILAPPAYGQSRQRVTTADDPSDDDLVWSKLSASDVSDLGRVAAGVAQQLTSERVRNLQSECLPAFNNLTAIVCVSCSAKHFRTADPAAYVLTKCSKAPTKITAAHNMDPGAVAEALQDLTTVEQMLIASVAPVMSVMQLSGYRGGQWRFKGHVTCFPQDIQPVVSVLPHVSVDVLVLRSQQSANADAVCEFCVSRQRVHDALLWLMEHNHYYGILAFRSRTSNNYPTTAHYSCG